MPDLQFQIATAPILLPVWIAGVVVWVVCLVHRRRLTPGRLLTVLLTSSYAAALVALTLLPLQVALGAYANQAAWYQKLNFIPLLTIDLRGFLLNIVMTVPLGMAVPLITRSRSLRHVGLVGLAVSLAIELTQLVTNVWLSSGRTADVNDLLANVLGAVVGWWIVDHLRRRVGWSRLLDRLTLYPEVGAPSHQADEAALSLR